MDDKVNSSSVFHQMSNKSAAFLTGKALVLLFIAIGLGMWGGYFLAAGSFPTNSSQTVKTLSNGSTIQVGTIYGSNDTTTFKDTADGVVSNGGINGEGQYHLVRPGGDSQNVYMTSSLVDLSLFVGKKVKVWGQTQKAQTAGWLMDVGRVEVEN